ncbi:hypothetical protein Rleg4DRAFT_2718 [Rhizobium leguminosarum bv. trifolii WSM2297]|uniref:Uncharacterized protein n=1 Tax=Rhizobium leguminosarum bv. trifolii WSM2297 TaxID=754762 RepID=J0W792_RHILT|nr:hypothetical protein [Rhizobium leguminosarum]EJC81048.1 hypothetical protein Rleg4DRAFT_2718 [Rhizobium leguminosarum bv. trifolii WSM2297]
MHSIRSKERGRKKLMLKLPALRDQLQLLPNDAIDELFESYELATTALDRFSFNAEANSKLIAEYEQLCRDIEAEVVALCAQHQKGSSLTTP